jgi:hypothetical protein
MAKRAWSEERARLRTQVTISFVMLLAGLLIIMPPPFLFPKGFDAGVKQMASFWIGAVIGYWLV